MEQEYIKFYKYLKISFQMNEGLIINIKVDSDRDILQCKQDLSLWITLMRRLSHSGVTFEFL